MEWLLNDFPMEKQGNLQWHLHIPVVAIRPLKSAGNLFPVSPDLC